jgi:hypothetical protein
MPLSIQIYMKSEIWKDLWHKVKTDYKSARKRLVNNKAILVEEYKESYPVPLGAETIKVD